ncbi:MAG: PAS domain S-box protein [Flavitalea sp.]
MEPVANPSSFLNQSRSIFYFTTDAEGNYTYANKLFKEIFYGNREISPFTSFKSVVTEENIELFNEAINGCLKDPCNSVVTDLQVKNDDGSTSWIHWEFFAIKEKEKVSGFRAIGTDANEIKKVESEKNDAMEKLDRERYLLRTLIDHLPDYIYVKDTHSRHVLNNRANVELFGAATEEETIGKTVLDYFDAESAGKLLARDKLLLLTGEGVYDQEEMVISKKGEKKWLLTTKVPLKEQDNKIIGLVGISRDITERKNIEESLRRSIERLDIVSKATNDSIWDWDLATGAVVWNDSVEAMFGYTQKEISHDLEWWEKHIHPSDYDRVVKNVNQHIEKGIESWRDEYRFICADKTEKIIFDRGYIVFDHENKPYRMIGAMMDITERKKLQNEIAANEIARQRQVTEAAIVAQERERGELGRELHDNINQILTTTKMYLDIAQNEKDISEELIIKSHENISSAIEEIRILSKSLVPPSLGDIGLKEAIMEMINNQKVSQKIDIKLRTSGFTKTSIPRGIQLMVFRIIQEQMNNIFKHSKATQVEIKITGTKQLLSVFIADNGVGFDPRKKVKGIGLMNITSRAEVHRGSVEIISSPGNGCTIKILIPV